MAFFSIDSSCALWRFHFLGLRACARDLCDVPLKKRRHDLIWKKQRVRVAKARPESYCYDRLLPCPGDDLPVRIEHLFVEKNGNVVDYLCQALSLPSLYVNDLIEFGAVYHALRCSEPPETAPKEHMEFYKRALAMDLPRVKGMSVQESQKARRIVSKHEEVEAGSYMRVHVHPRRFPRCYEVDWKSRILAENDLFVVLDKPAGVSVGGSVDNLEESCVTFASRALGMAFPLLVTHQIDNCTEGCVVLAKDKDFVSNFNRLLRTRKVDKRYLVLAAFPVPLGIVSHYMRPDHFAPHLLSQDKRQGWHLCSMEVLQCHQVEWPSEARLRENGVSNCELEHDGHAYECEVKLLTGKTHQVRAQFAALGAPILGDTIYIPAAIARRQNRAIDPVLRDDGQWSEEREERWILHHGSSAPKLAIGLQASSISWIGDTTIDILLVDEEPIDRESSQSNFSFHASSPWWRAT
ncbi:RNA pseudouridine synthase 6, chloroplastic isoform X2 [Selaginella moellendorffii]|uniref:RNA pseudouridine synthase 6, chloroplastic isoform X2 n=1 Tax=Selaginella moellendorffii TaxID=88036 RepID=UPI000D1CE74E|nr:RNA pseudouridine synthase 6, chloroplastic isoform X2 [Selaginella moellendorffii]|eukprot:XP_024522388.1 RNA pseudouridine synthase 6, chloroplastic isoform X2 [Selaginella moellendorffii]